ncbi:bifunctional dihydroorotate dehydrogenase B NAD binding subunit/NADPH-dependent glutamate synthase [Clostridium luticellarii]|jgi:glutamate synthase (NADPH/NADH) small chain|uniref:Glutamate synthase [NADPH] small chain n=1 Tax=Clostridium luticellarii TaxID=1691940 RepID=A0A2T0BST2_9CLOT|nr:bifunctional dihydroorotate dehydrogenase B NAD binding subunit/NADPH-dependent glutamate synthase [Clostridium luticellarii]PRR86937.1 Glutamate synthase [NADPH] small chain [Clostridium luticellarii]
MYKIVEKKELAPSIFLMDIEAPRVAKACLPGQFVIVKIDEKGERIPLTVCDYDSEKGTVTIVFQTIGGSTKRMAGYEVGEYFEDFVGPLGQHSDFVNKDIEELKKKNMIFVAGGVGTAPVYPQVKWLHEHGINADVIVGCKSKNYLLFEEELKSICDNLYIATDDGSYGYKGFVTDLLKELIDKKTKDYDYVVAIGPMIMMKFITQLTKKYGIKTIVSLNPIMVDGTGMCGACRVTVGGKVKFACVDGPEFDGHLIDFDEAMRRQAMYKTEEGKRILKKEEGDTFDRKGCECNTEKVDRMKRVPIKEQDPKIRATNFDEVCLGYTEEEAVREASRCLNCKKPMCVTQCPVSISIPKFIEQVKNRNFEEAAKIIAKSSALPAVCGRVCPQETQCEGKCVLGKKGDAVAIGKLERFVADWSRENNIDLSDTLPKNGKKIAVIGSGPSGLTCAGDLAKLGYDVTIFEALHKAGGVLVYGIPEFRLPKDTVVNHEVENVKKLGVKIETDVIVGRTITVDQLIEKEGFQAVFIGSGAGLPRFMGIPGENLNGVFSANEFLTRSNLMKAFKKDYDTPIKVGKKVAVVGGGNVAMDSARTALRLGAEVYIVYRRSESELPARAEEVHHAEEEGIKFHLLTNPVEILGDESGWVRGIRCAKMELGEPDESGRRRPVKIEGSEFDLDVDTVIMALGTSPNPLIASTTKGLEMNKRGCLVAREDTGLTTREGVYAGGDAVTGAATVILAMGAGKKAAKAIDEYLKR